MAAWCKNPCMWDLSRYDWAYMVNSSKNNQSLCWQLHSLESTPSWPTIGSVKLFLCFNWMSSSVSAPPPPPPPPPPPVCNLSCVVLISFPCESCMCAYTITQTTKQVRTSRYLHLDPVSQSLLKRKVTLNLRVSLNLLPPFMKLSFTKSPPIKEILKFQGNPLKF